MNRWIMQGASEWSDLLRSYQSSSFRLEAQQVYAGPDEAERLPRFLSGDPIIPDFEWRLSRWHERRAAGATSKITVRVVVEPPTDYTRMELYTYPIIAAGGEDIRVIVVAEGQWPDGLPDYDYFLFDEREVWRMHYHADHTFRGAEQLAEPDSLDAHLEWRDLALAHAIPLHEYRGVEMIHP